MVLCTRGDGVSCKSRERGAVGVLRLCKGSRSLKLEKCGYAQAFCELASVLQVASSRLPQFAARERSVPAQAKYTPLLLISITDREYVTHDRYDHSLIRPSL